MTAIAMRLVTAPLALAPDHQRPKSIRQVTLRELCQVARIRCRVTTDGEFHKILLHRGSEHFRLPDTYFVGCDRIERRGPMTRVAALRALEVLAYSFMDYGARESVCGRGLFVARKPVGRPSRLGRPRTAAERMRAMRARAKS